MKKLLFLIGIASMLTLFGLTTKPVLAKGGIDTCNYIKGGSIYTTFSPPTLITLGYNSLGYNYEKHEFNGKYCNAINNPNECEQFKDISLVMKWNDAWLSNKDCGTQGLDQGVFTPGVGPDTFLDRHYPSGSYIGSGASLTIDAKGNYVNRVDHWDVSGTYVFELTEGSVVSPYNVKLTQDGNVINGTISNSDTVPEGTITGNINGAYLTFNVSYSGNPNLKIMYGNILDNEKTIFGEWGETNYDNFWSTSYTELPNSYSETMCDVQSFIEVVAPPYGAKFNSYDNKWYFNNKEIGPAIWGNFAIVQNKTKDPCGKYSIYQYTGPR